MPSIRIGKLKALRQSLVDCRSLDETRACLGHLADQTGVHHVTYRRLSGGTGAVRLSTEPVAEPRAKVEKPGTSPRSGLTAKPAMTALRSVDDIVGHGVRPVSANDPLHLRSVSAGSGLPPGPSRSYFDPETPRSQSLVVPLHGPHGQSGVITLDDRRSDASWEFFLSLWQDEIWLFGLELHERVLELTGDLHRGVALSPREQEAMAVLASGGSRAEVAKRMGISEHTVRDHIVSARNKLGARSTMHAVAIAVSLGLTEA